MLPFSFHIRFLTLNQFMDLCDKLEAGLVQAQTEGGDLMEAVVHDSCGGGVSQQVYSFHWY
jgi:hypothetical protein